MPLVYHVFHGPPTRLPDNHGLVVAWLIETALKTHHDAYELPEHNEQDRAWDVAAAIVQAVTGLDREAAHRALNHLDELQADIAAALVNAQWHAAREAYEEGLFALTGGKVQVL